jgi:hypothetical protein
VRHPDDDAVARYALLPEGSAEDPEIRAHLSECAECTVRVSGVRAFLDTLSSPVSWDIAGVLDQKRGSEKELFAFAARVQQEYLDAHAALDPILTNAISFVRERVDRREQHRTLGAVRVLAEAANAACEREPIHARNLADAAVAIADTLPIEAYPIDAIRGLRGLAWKERANALRYLGEYDAALDALDHAAGEFEHFGARSFEFASLAYIRAVILTYTDRLDEATWQAALSAEIYAEYGESDLAMRARSVEAGVLYYRREYRAAVAIFEELMAFAESKKDAVETARQACNAAACSIELGEGVRAEALLTAARETYRTLAMNTEVAAAEWKLGVTSRVVGRLDESVARLRAAKASCEHLGMAAEVANASLDLVESLLLVGSRREIPALCSDVMRYYRRAGKLQQAMTAAAFLKEAATDGSIEVAAVKHVRRFVETLDRQPDLLFVPPSD